MLANQIRLLQNFALLLQIFALLLQIFALLSLLFGINCTEIDQSHSSIISIYIIISCYNIFPRNFAGILILERSFQLWT